jgi:hypothetical protein
MPILGVPLAALAQKDKTKVPNRVISFAIAPK